MNNLKVYLYLNKVFLIFYFFVQIFLIFYWKDKLDLGSIYGVLYLEKYSLFPISSYNSLSFSIYFGFFIFFFNIYLTIKLTENYIKGNFLNDINLIDLHKKNRLVYFLGYRLLNPESMMKIINQWSVFYKILAILGYIYFLFILFNWVVGFSMVDLPDPAVWISLISRFKIILFFFNLLIFIGISYLMHTYLAVVFFIFSCFLNKDKNGGL